MNRRDALKTATIVASSALGATAMRVSAAETTSADRAPAKPRFCLNTSTIRGQKLPIDKVVAITAAAGYDGIEPWIGELVEYQKAGGSLADLRKQIADAGLTVDSAIGFADWIVDDDARRAKGLETAKRDMDLVRQIGGTQIAAPPAGATSEVVELAAAAPRYAALIAVGREIGVTPMLELWGFSRTLSRIGEVAYVAVESGQADASMLLDVYHIYKGGSDFHGLKMLNGAAIGHFHFNDYPADPPRATIGDEHRVHCGDGVAPLSQIIRDLYATGFRGSMSLELFNRQYWEQDPAEVAKTGLEKMKAAVAKALDA
jgi:sugar phosphate isomerase/epimerase